MLLFKAICLLPLGASWLCTVYCSTNNILCLFSGYFQIRNEYKGRCYFKYVMPVITENTKPVTHYWQSTIVRILSPRPVNSVNNSWNIRQTVYLQHGWHTVVVPIQLFFQLQTGHTRPLYSFCPWLTLRSENLF